MISVSTSAEATKRKLPLHSLRSAGPLSTSPSIILWRPFSRTCHLGSFQKGITGVSRTLNGWRKGLPPTAVPFIQPETLEQRQPSPYPDMENVPAGEWDEEEPTPTHGIPIPVTPRVDPPEVKFQYQELDDDEYLVTSSKGTRKVKAHEDMSGLDMYLMTLANLTGELHWPMHRYTVSAEPSIQHDPTKPLPTREPFVRSMTVQVLKREGASLSQSLKWWRITSYLLLTLGLLCSLATSWSWMPGHDLLNASYRAVGGLIPMFLAVVFSLGLLVQRLGWFGWRRFLRLLWGRVTANESWKVFRVSDRLSGAFEGMNRVRSSQRSKRDSDTSTR
nr:MAG: hypothetical protein H4Bulk465132_000002 [Partitiviridae sp.]